MSNQNTIENNSKYIPEEFEKWEDIQDLKVEVLRGIYSYGFEYPSPIQKKAILSIIDKKDIIAQAQSGTGKTGAFVVGSLHLVDPDTDTTQCMILAPTRELSRQIYGVVNKLGQTLKNLRTHLLIGGTSTDEDIAALKKIPHIIVGCPGRIHDMIRRQHVSSKDIKFLVLDEADEMLSSGFKEQIYNIFQYMSNEVQVGLFSATMPHELYKLTEKFLRDPVKILVKTDMLTLEGLGQYYVALEDDSQKYATLKDLFGTISISQCIIYCNSIKRVADLYEAMKEDEFPVCCIHSGMEKEEREAGYKNFKEGQFRVLISSNVTARGIDIQQVSTVINFDIPRDVNIYLHRIGRSGRWGRKGVGINFVTRRDYKKIKDIEHHYNTEIKELPNDYVMNVE